MERSQESEMPLLTSLMKIVQTHLQHTSLGAYRFIVELERDLWRRGEGAMATLQAGHHENGTRFLPRREKGQEEI